MEPQTLVLNPWMSPHRVCTWQEAVILLVTGKIDVLEEYEAEIHSPNWTLQVPAVIRLRKPVSTFKKGVKFSRINVLTRDRFTCQYCGKKAPMKDLNYDHVIPRIQGGKTVWDNIVTSCYPCNDKKGGRTPEQAKMHLVKKPVRPLTLPMTQPLLNLRDVPESWRPYLDAARSMEATG